MSRKERVAVVGAGLMGHGIAQAFAVAGHPVSITDASQETLDAVHARVRANLDRVGVDPGYADAIEACDSLEETLAGAVFVTEAVLEDLELKQELFQRMDSIAPATTILATNTSVMSIGEIGARAVNRGRIIGTHWWNPPHLIPLVEVTQTDSTRADVIERTMALLSSLGKSPVHVRKDVPGFIGNRMQHALWREAIALVDAGVAEAADVDLVVKSSFGLRLSVLGPLENADLIGLDLTQAIHRYLLPHLDRTPGPSPLLSKLVERGDLGMKSGQGFRSWTDGEIEATRERLSEHLARAVPA